MLRRPGHVFSRDILFATVWGSDSDTEVGVVDRTISNLRAQVDHGFEKKLIPRYAESVSPCASNDVRVVDRPPHADLLWGRPSRLQFLQSSW